jgi:hypothetical protein
LCSEGIEEIRMPSRAHREWSRQWLEELNLWRNAIAHQNFDPALLGGTTNLQLARVQCWRRGCNKLARSLDTVLRAYIQSVTGSNPW